MKTKKRLWAFFLALALVLPLALALAPATAQAASGYGLAFIKNGDRGAGFYKLTSSGADASAPLASDLDGKWTYDPDANGGTLTLRNISFTTDFRIAMLLESTSVTTLVLEGTNSITSTCTGYTGTDAVSALTWSAPGVALTIQGDGSSSLALRAGTTTASRGSSVGLSTSGNLTVDNAVITATGGRSTQSGLAYGSYGITCRALTLKGGAHVTGTAGPSGSSAYGIQANSISFDTNADKNASVTGWCPDTAATKYGMYIRDGEPSVDGNVTIKAGADQAGASDQYTFVDSTYKIGGAPAAYVNLTRTPPRTDYGLVFKPNDSGVYDFYKVTASGGETTESAGIPADKWSYAEGSKTLTLTDFDFSTEYHIALSLDAVTVTNLALEGTNAIKSAVNTTYIGTSSYTTALVWYSSGAPLTVSGSGVLDLRGGSSTGKGSVGLDTRGPLVVENDRIYALGGLASGGSGSSIGLLCRKGLTLKGGATVEATTTGGSTTGYGVYAENGTIAFADGATGNITAHIPSGNGAAVYLNTQPSGVTVKAGSGVGDASTEGVTFEGNVYKRNGSPAAYAYLTPAPNYGLSLKRGGDGNVHLYKIGTDGQETTTVDDSLITSGKIAYDGGTKTLTLNSLSFTTSNPWGLQIDGSLVSAIVLNGSSKIKSTCSAWTSPGETAMLSYSGPGPLTIKGSGDLFLQAGSNQATGGIIAGLDAPDAALTVENTLISINAGAASAGTSYGARFKSITLKGTGKLAGNMPYQSAAGYAVHCAETVSFVDANASDINCFLSAKSEHNTALYLGSEHASAKVAAASDYNESDLGFTDPSFDNHTYKINGAQAKVVVLSRAPVIDYSLYFDPTLDGGAFRKNDSSGNKVNPQPGGWAYDQTTNTLTLDGFRFSTSSPLAVQVPRDINIALQGDNSITTTYSGAPGGSNLVAALTVPPTSSGGHVKITGTGTLTLAGGNNTGGGISAGLYATGALTINGAKVSATAGDSTNGFSIGIQASQGLSLENNANVNAKAGAAARSFGARTTALSIPAGGGTLEAKGDTYALVYETTTPNTDPGLGTILADHSVTAGADAASAATAGVTVGTPDGYTYIYQANGTAAKYVKISPKAAPTEPNYTLVLGPDGKFHKGTAGGEVVDPAPGKWSYNPSTKTLTLQDGFSFTTKAAVGMQVPEGTVIAVAGDSSITSTYDGDAAPAAALATESGDLTIKGPRTLTLAGGNSTATRDNGHFAPVGLYVHGKLTIDNATVNATGGTGNAAQYGFSSGIYAGTELSLINNANVTATGGTAFGSTGVYAGTLSISAGSGILTATGGTCGIHLSSDATSVISAIIANPDLAVKAGNDAASAGSENIRASSANAGSFFGSTFSAGTSGMAKYVKISSAIAPAGSGLTVSATALDFGGSQAAGTEASQTITVALDSSVAGANKSIAYALSGAGFQVEPAPGWSDATGGSLKVIFAPGAAQAYSGTLTLTLTVDGTAKTPVAITLSGTATGGGTPSPSPSPLPTPGGGSGGGGYTPPETTVYNDPSRPKADVWITGSGLKEEDLLITEQLPQGADYNFLLSLAAGADVVRVYDIRLQSGQTSLPGNALVFDLGSGYAGQAFTLLHKKADGTVEYLYGTADGSGQVRFHPIYELSPFLLAKGTLAQTGLVNIPKTGDGSGMALGALLLLTAAAGWAVSRRRKLSQK